MRKHLYYLIASMLIITISLNARTNYNYKKLQRENLGRGVVAIRKDASTVTFHGDTSHPTLWIPSSTYIVTGKNHLATGQYRHLI